MPGPMTVVVPNVPSATFIACRRHIDALLAEGERLRPMISTAAMTVAGADAIVAVADVFRELKERQMALTDQVLAARAAGKETVDVIIEARDERTLDLFARWIDLIMRCDAYCHSGDLDVPAAPLDVTAARQRFLRSLLTGLDDTWGARH